MKAPAKRKIPQFLSWQISTINEVNDFCLKCVLCQTHANTYIYLKLVKVCATKTIHKDEIPTYCTF